MHTPMPKALRAIVLSLVSLAACATSTATESTATYPTLAEAELVGMGYASFDAVLAEALSTPKAAGHAPMSQRATVEEVIARTMGGLMP